MYLALHGPEHEVQPLVRDLVVDQVQMFESFREARRYFLQSGVIDHAAVQLDCVQILEMLESLRQVLLVTGHKAHPEDLQRLAPEEKAHLWSGQVVLAQQQLHGVGHKLKQQEQVLLLQGLLGEAESLPPIGNHIILDQVLFLLFLLPFFLLASLLFFSLGPLLPGDELLLQSLDFHMQLLNFSHLLLDLVLASFELLLLPEHFLLGLHPGHLQVVALLPAGHLVRGHVLPQEGLLVVVGQGEVLVRVLAALNFEVVVQQVNAGLDHLGDFGLGRGAHLLSSVGVPGEGLVVGLELGLLLVDELHFRDDLLHHEHGLGLDGLRVGLVDNGALDDDLVLGQEGEQLLDDEILGLLLELPDPSDEGVEKHLKWVVHFGDARLVGQLLLAQDLLHLADFVEGVDLAQVLDVIDELAGVQVQVLRHALLADDLVGALRVGAEQVTNLLVDDAVSVDFVIHLLTLPRLLYNIYSKEPLGYAPITLS